MFEDFFENNAPVDEETLGEASREQIRTAVMERISRESEAKKMKHRFMRPFIIVAAAVSASLASLITANAATDGALIDTITKPFTIYLDGEPVEVEAAWQEVEMEDGEKGDVLTITLPDSDEDVWISAKELGDTDSDATISYYRADPDGDIETINIGESDGAGESSEDSKNIVVNKDGWVYYYGGDIETISIGKAEAYADGETNSEIYWTDEDGKIEVISTGEAEADVDGAWESSEDAKNIVVNKDGTVYYYDGDIETIRAEEAEADTSADKDIYTIRKDETGESADVYYYQYDGEDMTAILADEYNAAKG